MNRKITSIFLRATVILFMSFISVNALTNDVTDYTFTLTTEYTSVPCIYAGSPNYFKLEMKNTSETDGLNVIADLFIGEELIWKDTIDTVPAGETVNVVANDPTIRPITENTIWGNNNDTVVYKLVIKEADVVKKQQEFRYGVVYNGNLGKDYAYPSLDTTLRVYSFTGDVQVLVKDYESNMNASTTSRDEDFSIDLGGGSVHKALLYVSYNWDKIAEGDFNSWTTSFNDNPIVPIASYRDCGNLGNYGRYGYGMVVYDVTDYVADGNNTFALQKSAGNVSVYPSSMIVMVENPSAKPKAVYIVEEADLLSHAYNKNIDAIYPSSFEGIAGENAKLYVFAAGAQSGEGDIIINDTLHSDVWSGTSYSVEVFENPFAPGDISVKFKATGSSIMALQQMVVVGLEDKTTGVVITEDDERKIKDAPWFGLDGRKLDGKPSERGVYIHGNKKVVIL